MACTPQFRPLTETDLPAARQLWAEADGVELSEGDSVEELTQYLLRNPGMSYAALSGETLVGAVLAGYDGRRGFLYHLAVAGDYRRSRIGRALVAHALAALKAARVVRVLILVSSDNEIGQAFWSRQGWEHLTFAQPFGIDL
jgi:ribosomal protein S18 acetylase RimI-like enzyme